MSATATISAIPRAYSPSTLRGAIDAFMAYADLERGWSEQTRQAYAYDLGLFERWINSHTSASPSLDEILTAEAYSAFVLSFARDRKVGASRRWRLLASGRSFLTFTARKHITPHVELELLERPKLPRRLPRHLELPQAKALRVSADNLPLAARAIILTLLFTGIRVGELVSLNTSDLLDHAIRVRGKGDKERLIPLPPEPATAIIAYLPQRESHAHPALFTTAKGRISIRTVQRICANAALQAELPSTHPHNLRHTYATLLHQGGADIVEISRLLGHASIATTQIYTHSSADHLRAAVARMPPLS